MSRTIAHPGWPAANGIHRIVQSDGRCAWLKRRQDRPASFMAAEARGLKLLATPGGLRVPDVLELGEHHLLIEDLGSGSPSADFPVRAGHGLAAQHHRKQAMFGLKHDGWCGDSAQDNTPDADGYRFFSERRLLAQGRRALASGKLQRADMQHLENLCAKLQHYIPEQPAVLLHGDLWSGNLHCCENGEPALIDAGAVHYGWAEAELAMLTLFGGPGQDFFRAYAEVAPLADDWRDRAPLYNLYHLLNHLNLFGAGYLNSVRQVLKRFG